MEGVTQGPWSICMNYRDTENTEQMGASLHPDYAS